MYSAVHSDRSGRVFVSADHAGAAHDGARTVPFDEAIPLPPGAQLIPMPREAEGLDRAGRARPLGRGRLALAAILRPGYTRALHPAYRDAPGDALDPLPYAAVAADASGEIVAAAVPSATPSPEATEAEPAAAAERNAALQAYPANRLVRQLARCAREYRCRSAQLAFRGGTELPVPLSAPRNERPRVPIDLASGRDERPEEGSVFQPSAADVVELVLELAAGGPLRVSFGRACDGEPLLAVRALEEVIRAVRERTDRVDLHLETNGSVPAALRRAIDAGLDGVTVRLASARAEVYEVVHGPEAYRWADVRASLQLAAERRIRITVALLVLPGLTDRPAETDALVALLGELPAGTIELRDLGADPLRTLAALPRSSALGIRALLDRLAEADHFRMLPAAERATA